MKPAPIDPPEIHDYLWSGGLGFKGTVGWDIGANCGQTIPEMKKRFTTVHVFEPAEECWPALEKFDGITLHKIAVSDENGEVPLVVLPDKIDTGQLVTGNCLGMEWDPETPNATLRTLPSRTVDSLIEEIGAPDFMKIDVEGHEEKVLIGAEYTIRTYRPDLLIEFHSPELYDFCISFLRDWSYKTETVRHPHYKKDSHLWFQHGWIRTIG